MATYNLPEITQRLEEQASQTIAQLRKFELLQGQSNSGGPALFDKQSNKTNISKIIAAVDDFRKELKELQTIIQQTLESQTANSAAPRS